MAQDLTGDCQNFTNRRPFMPSDHQIRIPDLLSKTSERGLLLLHQLGSGKTCTSIKAADAILSSKVKGIKRVHVFTSGALRANFISEYCSLCGKRPKDFKKRYHFWTYNASNITKVLEDVDLDDSVIIVDEVQKVISEYLHKAPRGVYIYNRLLKARNVVMILLSATPIRQSPIEIAYIANLLVLSPQRGFGTLRSQFEKYIKGEFGDMKIVDPVGLARKLYGIISFVPSSGTEFYPELIKDPGNTYYIRMNQEQYRVYLKTRIKEKKWRKISRAKIEDALRKRQIGMANLLKGLKTMGWNRSVSRRAGNILVPNDLTKIGYTFENPYTKLFQAVYYGSLNVDDELMLGLTQKQQKDAPKETLMVLKNVEPRGWITGKYIKDLRKWSPKYMKLLENIVRLPGKHAVYTENKERGGVYFIQALLQTCGIPSVIYAGGLTDKQRKGVVGAFNTPQNDDGHLIKAFILTSAGMTGISLLTTRHLHQLDPIGSPVEQLQFEGRVIRYRGHERLPRKERTVTLYQYLSVVPEFDPNDDIGIQIIGSSDIEIFYKGKKGLNDLDTLNDLLKRVAVDCPEYLPKEKCYRPSELEPSVKKEKIEGMVSINDTTPFHDAKETLILYGLRKNRPFTRMPNKGSIELMKKYNWARPTKKGMVIPGPGQYVRVGEEPTEEYVSYSLDHTLIKKGVDTLIWGFIVDRIHKPTASELSKLASKIKSYENKTGNTINSVAIYGEDYDTLGGYYKWSASGISEWIDFAKNNNISVVVYLKS